MQQVLELKIEGLDGLLTTFKRYFDDIDSDEIILQALARIGKEVEARAKDILQEKIYNTPERGYVRTGMLRARTISDAPKKGKDGPEVTIRSKQYYAVYVELGTSKMKPRAFLLPAAQDKKDDALDILKKALTDFLKQKIS